MGMDVDESGGDDLSLSINLTPTCSIHMADFDDTVPIDCYVANPPG
jgi:hypothetical protein